MLYWENIVLIKYFIEMPFSKICGIDIYIGDNEVILISFHAAGEIASNFYNKRIFCFWYVAMCFSVSIADNLRSY